MPGNDKIRSDVISLLQNRYVNLIAAAGCLLFNLSLAASHYYHAATLLAVLNVLKYPVILLLSLCLYRSYTAKDRSGVVVFAVSLLFLWFVGFGSTYGWDSIQHVSRAKYYMEHPFFGGGERHSVLYLIWGGAYAVFGESSSLTHLTTIISGLIGILGIALIARDLFDEDTAVVSLLVSLSFPLFFILSKWAYLDMPYLTAIIISFFFLLRYLYRDRLFYLVLSVVCMFLASGIKESGLAVIPIAVLGFLIFRKWDWKGIAVLAGAAAACSIYLYFVSYAFIVHQDLVSDFSTVSPLNYGLGALMMWFEELGLELSQILWSGVAILAFASVIRMEKDDTILVSGMILVQSILFVLMGIFGTKNSFYYPLIPWQNTLPYLLLFLGFIGFIGMYLLLKRKRDLFEMDNGRLFLIAWILAFLLFFMVNQKISNLPLVILDFRYLMPLFPPLIILFSSGVTRIMRADLSRVLRYAALLILAAVIVFNTVIGLNFSFYYANSRENALEGYQALKESGSTIAYTHWPFYYPVNGEVYDAGGFTWRSDHITPRNIFSGITPTNGSVLFSHFFPPDRLLNFDLERNDVTSYLLNPTFPPVAESHEFPVYLGRVPEFPIVAVSGFHDRFSWDGIPTYWTEQDFTVYISSRNKTEGSIGVSALGFTGNRTAEIYVNGDLKSLQEIPPAFTALEIPSTLREGQNIVRIHVREDCRRPGEIAGWKTGDMRCISLAVRNFTFTPTL